MERRICSQCGYRINPETALPAGLISRAEYESEYVANPVKSWCEKRQGWIRDSDSCEEWTSWQVYNADDRYR